MKTTLGQLLAQDPRPVGVVLLDALHTADAILQHAKIQVGDGEATPDKFSRLVEASERAVKISKTAIDGGIAAKLLGEIQHDQQAQAELMVQAMTAAVNHVLDNLPQQLDEVDRQRFTTLALSAAFASLNGVSMPDLIPRLSIMPADHTVARSHPTKREPYVQPRSEGDETDAEVGTDLDDSVVDVEILEPGDHEDEWTEILRESPRGRAALDSQEWRQRHAAWTDQD
jgi:hypothetical protein